MSSSTSDNAALGTRSARVVMSALTFVAYAAAISLGVIIIVLGTYGTSDELGNPSGTVYAIYALPLALGTICLLFLLDVLRRRPISIYVLVKLEGQLFLAILFLILISTYHLPEYLATSLFTVVLSLTVVLFIVGRLRTEDDFRRMFRFYQSMIYTTAVLALLTGVCSIVAGPVTIGPVQIEYRVQLWRMNSWFNASTMLGVFLCHGILAAYYFLSTTENRLTKALHLTTILGFVLGITLAGGRTGAVVVVLAFGSLLVVLRTGMGGWTNRRVFFGAVLTGLVILLIGYYAEDVFLLRRFVEEEDVGPLGGRFQFLSEALRALSNARLDELVFGYGVNGVARTLKWDNSPHSGMLRIALEHGLLVVAIYFLLNIIMLLKLSQSVRRKGPLYSEAQVVFLMIFAFFVSESMVIQMFGVDLFYALFLAAFSFYLALSRLERVGSQHLEVWRLGVGGSSR